MITMKCVDCLHNVVQVMAMDPICILDAYNIAVTKVRV